jgi:hypothetical protein
MPGTAAIFVVAGTVAVIAAGDARVAWSPTRLLTWRPATFVGDISYSMYLWHWPILVILPYVIDAPAGFVARVFVLVATVLAAWATKVLVEDPVRTTRRFRLRRAGVALTAAMVAAAALVAVCASAWWHVERENRHSVALAKSLVADAPPCFGAAARDPQERGCPNPELKDSLVPDVAAAANDYAFFPWCEKKFKSRPMQPCSFGAVHDKSVPHVAVIGDSHLRALMPALLELAKKKVLSLDLFTSGGCIWAEGRPNIQTKSLRELCINFKAGLKPLLQRTARQYDFVLTTAWTNKVLRPIDSPVAAIKAVWAPIVRMKVPIVAVRDNPSAGGKAEDNPNNCLAEVSVAEANDKCGLDRHDALDRFADPYAAAVRATPRAHLVDLTPFYCDARTCPVVIGGVNVYRDNSHITVTYSRTLAPYLYRALVRTGVLPPP